MLFCMPRLCSVGSLSGDGAGWAQSQQQLLKGGELGRQVWGSRPSCWSSNVGTSPSASTHCLVFKDAPEARGWWLTCNYHRLAFSSRGVGPIVGCDNSYLADVALHAAGEIRPRANHPTLVALLFPSSPPGGSWRSPALPAGCAALVGAGSLPRAKALPQHKCYPTETPKQLRLPNHPSVEVWFDSKAPLKLT